MKSAEQVARAAAVANSMVGRIRRTFTYMEVDMFKPLYATLVRSKMEFAVQAWSPYLKKDIDMLEKVQRRATKLVPAISHLPYEERMKILDLTTLEERRRRGDMIEVYRILHGIDHVHAEGDFLKLEEGNARRGHNLKLVKPRHRTEKRSKFFPSRVVTQWNQLPAEVVNSPSVNAFKNRYDKFVLQ